MRVINTNIQTITLGGGCFWCLDAAYKLVNGVRTVIEGYAGGTTVNPTSEQVYSGNTGHAEVVQLTFDTTLISLTDILDIFWTLHDPTSLNRQGIDIGTQYRSIIFYQDDTQKMEIEINQAYLPAVG